MRILTAIVLCLGCVAIDAAAYAQSGPPDTPTNPNVAPPPDGEGETPTEEEGEEGEQEGAPEEEEEAVEPPGEVPDTNQETIDALLNEPHVEPPASEEDSDAPVVGPWGGPRWFLAGRVDLGFLFLRPVFQGGFGTPHTTWFGLEINPLISGRGVGIYGGLHGQVPFGQLRAGARYFYTFTRSFLTPMDTFDHIQILDRTGPHSSYLALEAQLDLHIPIGPVTIQSETTLTYITLVEPGYYIYEETLRVVLAPPFIWGTQLGLQINFGDHGEFWIAPGAELVHLVDRSEIVLRVGLRAGIRLWTDLDILLITYPAVVGPDPLGAGGGDTFLLGLRYRWTTDKPANRGPYDAFIP